MEYSFDIEVAKKYGVEEAILIKNFQFWISKNKASGRHLHEDRTWTYNSVKAFCSLFPFWTTKQIRRILKSLLEQNVTVEGNYNEMASDRKIWYAFKDESIFLNGLFHLPKREHPFAQTGTPLADSKPDSKPDNTNIVDHGFDSIWLRYPIPDGKKGAEKHFHATVKTEEDYQNIKKALDNYILHLGVNDWKKPKNGSTWFNNWKDWVNWKEPMPIKKPLQVVL